MGTITTFDHTADVGLLVQAGDLDDLFQTAAEGLFDYVVANRAEVRPVLTETFSLNAEGLEELLVQWLNELIFRSETRHQVYAWFEARVAEDGRSLTATIQGEPIDRERHSLDHEVKAVTRHGLSLERRADQWVATLVLDI